MTVRVRAATEPDRAGWEALVAARPEADILQAWSWGEAAADSGGPLPHRLVAVDAEGRISGVAQLEIRPTLFGRRVLYAPHGPVWERDHPDGSEILRVLLDGLRDLGRRQRGIVLKLDPRGTIPTDVDVAAELLPAGARPARHDLQARTTRIVDLMDGGERLLASWSREARAAVRRAAREGLSETVDREGEPRVLDAFHALLTETSQRGHFPIRSRDFLRAQAAALAPRGDWFLSLASHDGRPVAGVVAPRVGDRAYYLYGASSRDPELVHKRGPYAAMATLMRAHAGAGTRTLDLWGVRERDDASVDPTWEGFSHFKRQFGGQPLRHPGTFDVVLDPVWFRLRDLRERLRWGSA